MPERHTVCGLLLALSAIVIEAVSLPANEGVKVTLIAQFPPAATELAQVSATSTKSPLLAPVIVMLVMLKGAPPVLLKVNV